MERGEPTPSRKSWGRETKLDISMTTELKNADWTPLGVARRGHPAGVRENRRTDKELTK